MFTFYFWTAALLCGLAMDESFGSLNLDKRAMKLDKREYSGCVVDLAEGKPTGQSSTYPGAISHRAVDGIWSPQWGVGSCSSTVKQKNPFWWVDLGGQYHVLKVAIQNRADCCPERLSRVRVWVGDNLHNMSICATHGKAAGKGEVLMLQCRYNTRGRFVKIELMKTDLLTMCEVAVYGFNE